MLNLDNSLAKYGRMCHKLGKVNKGNTQMLKTIMIGRYMSIQGKFVRTTPNGLVVVRVDDKTFAGRPVKAQVA